VEIKLLMFKARCIIPQEWKGMEMFISSLNFYMLSLSHSLLCQVIEITSLYVALPIFDELYH
jgi:hypothetical protein